MTDTLRVKGPGAERKQVDFNEKPAPAPGYASGAKARRKTRIGKGKGGGKALSTPSQVMDEWRNEARMDLPSIRAKPGGNSFVHEQAIELGASLSSSSLHKSIEKEDRDREKKKKLAATHPPGLPKPALKLPYRAEPDSFYKTPLKGKDTKPLWTSIFPKLNSNAVEDSMMELKRKREMLGPSQPKQPDFRTALKILANDPNAVVGNAPPTPTVGSASPASFTKVRAGPRPLRFTRPATSMAVFPQDSLDFGGDPPRANSTPPLEPSLASTSQGGEGTADRPRRPSLSKGATPNRSRRPSLSKGGTPNRSRRGTPSQSRAGTPSHGTRVGHAGAGAGLEDDGLWGGMTPAGAVIVPFGDMTDPFSALSGDEGQGQDSSPIQRYISAWDNLPLHCIGDNKEDGERPDLHVDLEAGKQDWWVRGAAELVDGVEQYAEACARLCVHKSYAVEQGLRRGELALNMSPIGPAGGEALAAALRLNTFVVILSMPGCCLGDRGAIALANAIKANPHITKCDLSNNGLSTAAGEAFASVLSWKDPLTGAGSGMKVLMLDNNERLGSGLRPLLEAAARNRSIEELSLSHTGAADNAGTAMTYLIAETVSLQALSMSYNSLMHSWKPIMAALATNLTLKKLNISFNGLGEAHGLLLAEALASNEHLVVLDICGCRLGKEAWFAIAGAIKTNTKLQMVIMGLQEGEQMLDDLKECGVKCRVGMRLQGPDPAGGEELWALQTETESPMHTARTEGDDEDQVATDEYLHLPRARAQDAVIGGPRVNARHPVGWTKLYKDRATTPQQIGARFRTVCGAELQELAGVLSELAPEPALHQEVAAFVTAQPSPSSRFPGAPRALSPGPAGGERLEVLGEVYRATSHLVEGGGEPTTPARQARAVAASGSRQYDSAARHYLEALHMQTDPLMASWFMRSLEDLHVHRPRTEGLKRRHLLLKIKRPKLEPDPEPEPEPPPPPPEPEAIDYLCQEYEISLSKLQDLFDKHKDPFVEKNRLRELVREHDAYLRDVYSHYSALADHCEQLGDWHRRVHHADSTGWAPVSGFCLSTRQRWRFLRDARLVDHKMQLAEHNRVAIVCMWNDEYAHLVGESPHVNQLGLTFFEWVESLVRSSWQIFKAPTLTHRAGQLVSAFMIPGAMTRSLDGPAEKLWQGGDVPLLFIEEVKPKLLKIYKYFNTREKDSGLGAQMSPSSGGQKAPRGPRSSSMAHSVAEDTAQDKLARTARSLKKKASIKLTTLIALRDTTRRASVVPQPEEQGQSVEELMKESQFVAAMGRSDAVAMSELEEDKCWLEGDNCQNFNDFLRLLARMQILTPDLNMKVVQNHAKAVLSHGELLAQEHPQNQLSEITFEQFFEMIYRCILTLLPKGASKGTPKAMWKALGQYFENEFFFICNRLIPGRL